MTGFVIGAVVAILVVMVGVLFVMVVNLVEKWDEIRR